MAKTKTIPSHKNIVGFSNYLAGGDANATILLARIVYWMPLATITHNGHRWIAKSLADWCAEACLEHWTCRRALATLRKRGLVCTERHLFKHYNLTHVRLTADAIAAFSGEGVSATLRKNGRSEACNAAPKSASKSARFFNTGDTEQEVQTKKENREDCELFEPASDQDLSEKEDFEMIEPVAKENPETAVKPGIKVNPETAENPETAVKPVIMKNPETAENPEMTPKPERTKKPVMTCAQVQEKTHKPEPTGGLEQLWLATYAEAYGKFAPGFTMKQRGQLKQFVSKCPPATAESVVVHVVSNWPVFCLKAEKDAGTKTSPVKPHVGFLLQNVATAVDYYLDSVQPKQQLSQLQVLHAFKLAQPPSSKHAPVNQTKSTQTPAKLVHETDGVSPEPTQPQPARVKPPKLKKLDKAETDAEWNDYFPHGKPKGC